MLAHLKWWCATRNDTLPPVDREVARERYAEIYAELAAAHDGRIPGTPRPGGELGPAHMAVGQLLGVEGSDDERVLYVEEELGQLFTRMLAQDGIEKMITKDWNSGLLETTTKKESMRCEQPHVSIIGHITPDELFDRLEHRLADNGFSNRWLYMLIKPTQVKFLEPRPEDVPDLAEACAILTGTIRSFSSSYDGQPFHLTSQAHRWPPATSYWRAPQRAEQSPTMWSSPERTDVVVYRNSGLRRLAVAGAVGPVWFGAATTWTSPRPFVCATVSTLVLAGMCALWLTARPRVEVHRAGVLVVNALSRRWLGWDDIDAVEVRGSTGVLRLGDGTELAMRGTAQCYTASVVGDRTAAAVRELRWRLERIGRHAH